MSAHTPGPWHVCDMITNAAHVASKSGFVIAAVGGNGAYERAQPANARLIAAAPDMLAALEAILPFVPPEHAKMSMVGSLAHLQAANDVRAAIAKATNNA